ncbi:MAG: hypothetical protein RMX60_06475, partial [Planktomarina sp.]|nr:hypothetical protein [Planktomarina sp.]MDT2073096.1 hypothetical protein [Planktomarina sp.]
MTAIEIPIALVNPILLKAWCKSILFIFTLKRFFKPMLCSVLKKHLSAAVIFFVFFNSFKKLRTEIEYSNPSKPFKEEESKR